MDRLNHEEDKRRAYDGAANEWHSWDSNLGVWAKGSGIDHLVL